MLHLSAVSPSYYRFHVEHLQSDDYSKDKVEHDIHLKIPTTTTTLVTIRCSLILARSLGCSSLDW